MGVPSIVWRDTVGLELVTLRTALLLDDAPGATQKEKIGGLMRYVAGHREEAQRVGAQARRNVVENFSTERASEVMKEGIVADCRGVSK